MEGGGGGVRCERRGNCPVWSSFHPRSAKPCVPGSANLGIDLADNMRSNALIARFQKDTCYKTRLTTSFGNRQNDSPRQSGLYSKFEQSD